MNFCFKKDMSYLNGDITFCNDNRKMAEARRTRGSPANVRGLEGRKGAAVDTRGEWWTLEGRGGT